MFFSLDCAGPYVRHWTLPLWYHWNSFSHSLGHWHRCTLGLGCWERWLFAWGVSSLRSATWATAGGGLQCVCWATAGSGRLLRAIKASPTGWCSLHSSVGVHHPSAFPPQEPRGRRGRLCISLPLQRCLSVFLCIFIFNSLIPLKCLCRCAWPPTVFLDCFPSWLFMLSYSWNLNYVLISEAVPTSLNAAII